MNSDTTRQILVALEAAAERYPAMRFGQLVANAAYWAKGPVPSAVWDVEDEEFLQALYRHLESTNEGAGETRGVPRYVEKIEAIKG